jgi:hypothetical protein
MKNINILPLFLIGSAIALGQENCIGDDANKARRGLNALAWDVYWSTSTVLLIPQELEVLHFYSTTFQGACFGTIDRCVLFGVTGQDSSMQPIARDVAPRKEKSLVARAEEFLAESVASFHGKVMLLPEGIKLSEDSGSFQVDSRIVKVPIASHGVVADTATESIRYHACKCQGMHIGWSPPPNQPKVTLPKSLDSLSFIFRQFYLNRKKVDGKKQAIRITIPWFSDLDHSIYVLVEGDGKPKITVCTRSLAGAWSAQRGFTDQFDRMGFQAIRQKILDLEVKKFIIN